MRILAFKIAFKIAAFISDIIVYFCSSCVRSVYYVQRYVAQLKYDKWGYSDAEGNLARCNRIIQDYEENAWTWVDQL